MRNIFSKGQSKDEEELLEIVIEKKQYSCQCGDSSETTKAC